MNSKLPSSITQPSGQGFRIEVRGHLDFNWSDWFEGLTVTHQPDGQTVIAGPLVDQATLYAVLIKARNLGLPLISVNPLPEGDRRQPQKDNLNEENQS